jgi:hypothetical protein
MSFALLSSTGAQSLSGPILLNRPVTSSTPQLDTNVKTAWENKRLTDGTKLDLGLLIKSKASSLNPKAHLR